MALSDITREGIIAALGKYDEIGRDNFLNKYGFKPTRKYVLCVGEKYYEAKPICAVAHKFDRPGDGPLKEQDSCFSTIALTVNKLKALGFTVLDELPTLEIKDETGKKVKATCEISHDKKGWAVTLHSRGGAKGTDGERNSGYHKGLEILISRLASNNAVITEVLLDSGPAHKLNIKARRLTAVPKSLGPSTDVVALSKQITHAAAAIRKAGVVKPGGNPTKQVRISFELDAATSLAEVESLLVGGLPADRPVFVLTWNPVETEIDDDEIAELARTTQSGRTVSQNWSTGTRKGGINPGDYVVRFRQINNRGFVALGRATSYVYEGKHWADKRKLANYVDVAWEQILRTEDRLAIEDIEMLTQDTHWDAVLGSGIKLSEGDSRIVVETWNNWIAQVVGPNSNLSGEEAGASSTMPGGVSEGAVVAVLVNRYE